MQVQNIFRYFFTLSSVLIVLFVASPVVAQTDTTATEEEESEPKAKPLEVGHQLCIGVDIFNPIVNSFSGAKSSYEGAISYYLKNEYYLAAEGGMGGSKADYDDLKYTSNNYFGRIGFNKSLLTRNSDHDWDMLFAGMRVAMANVKRSAATYTITDTVWGDQTGLSEAKSFAAVWAEVTLGMRVELLRGVMAGWNLRAKFMMNGRSFEDVAPLNIAGFGQGDKNANFNFNLYVCYAIRWHK